MIGPLQHVTIKEEAAQRVSEKLADRKIGAITFKVVAEGIVLVNDWWRVPVRPSAWPDPMFAFYEITADVEGELVDEDRLNILITTSEPLSEQVETEPAIAPKHSGSNTEKARSQNKHMAENEFSIYEILEKIRPKPALYIGTTSITRLSHFVEGYRHGLLEHGYKEVTEPSFSDFHFWVRTRLNQKPLSLGWSGSILKVCGGDEARAIERFYELLDEYRSGQFAGLIEQWVAK